MIRVARQSNTSHPISYTVLIVGDRAARELYSRYFHLDSSCHYTLLEAEAANPALLLCQNRAIDGILVDERLQDGTGLEFVQTLKIQWAGVHPPVVMVAHEDDPTVSVGVAVQRAVGAMKLGLEDYLIKNTLTPAQVQVAMQSAIQRTQSQLQSEGQEELSRIQQLNRDLAHRVTELQTLIDMTPVGIAIATNPSCSQMHHNAYICQLLGVSLGHNISKSAPAEEQPLFRVFQNGEEVIAENLPMQRAARLGIDVRDVELEIWLPNGTVRQLLSYASPLQDDRQQIRGAIGAFLDITDRKQSEAQLREREATIQRQLLELEGIYASAPVGLCFQDRDLRYVRINDRLAEIDGVSVSDHLGRTIREILPNLADILEPLQSQVIETGEPILNIEIHGTTQDQPDLERDWVVSYYPLKDTDGYVLGLNVTVQEITALKQAQAERERLLHQLELEHSFLEQTLQQMPSGVAISEAPTGKLLFHNDEAIRLLRHPMKSAETYNGYAEYGVLQIDGRPYRPDEYPIARAVLFGEVVKAEEMRYRRGDGTETIFSVNAAPIIDRQGRRIAAVSTFEDIAERKQIERERQQLLAEAQSARAEAEAANRSKDEFVAMVAHELRSPLNAILGWAQLLQTRQLPPTIIQKALTTIIRNTQAQAQLVEDLLDVSRMVRGALQLTRTSVELTEVVEVAVETVRPTAEAKGLHLEMQIQEVPAIVGDLARLQQVVLNLLTNAIKFTPQGGRVEVILDRNPSQAQIQVRDTGKGIQPDFLPHIFERFRQDRHETTTQQGWGLGLTIVKHLVEMHQGRVTVESAGVGQGSIFTVRLPLLTPEELEERETDPGHAAILSLPHHSLTDIRVLLVDDEPDVLNLSAFILEEYGAVVQMATSTRSALEHLLPFQPQVLLSDIAMPEQDGYELLRRMRSIHPEGQIPAIALTAYANQSQREKSLNAGFQQHLAKPIEPEQLVAAILNAIGRRRS